MNHLPFGIEAVQRVGPEPDRRVEGELQRIAGLLEDVLGHDPHRVPAHRVQGMEARVRLLQLVDHGVAVGRRDAGDVDLDRRAPAQALGVEVRLDRVHHVGRSELDAVAPVDALAQLHRHLGEVLVVDGLLGGQRVVPHAVDTAVGVDVPEGVHRQLVQPGRLTAGIDGPDVEPARVLDRALGVLDDQRLVARQVGDHVLRQRCAERQQGQGGEQQASHHVHWIHLVIVTRTVCTPARWRAPPANPSESPLLAAATAMGR